VNIIYNRCASSPAASEMHHDSAAALLLWRLASVDVCRNTHVPVHGCLRGLRLHLQHSLWHSAAAAMLLSLRMPASSGRCGAHPTHTFSPNSFEVLFVLAGSQ
jgi:hypothetical protein